MEAIIIGVSFVNREIVEVKTSYPISKPCFLQTVWKCLHSLSIHRLKTRSTVVAGVVSALPHV